MYIDVYIYIYMCIALRRSSLLQPSSNTSLLATADGETTGLLIPRRCSLPAIGGATSNMQIQLYGCGAIGWGETGRANPTVTWCCDPCCCCPGVAQVLDGASLLTFVVTPDVGHRLCNVRHLCFHAFDKVEN